MSERKPLTLEELRKMDGQPVQYEATGEIFIVDLDNPDFGECLVNSDGYYIPLHRAVDRAFGRRFFAYERPRLDRSAWEPCEYCRERDREVYKTQDYLGLCSFEVAQDGPDEIVVNAYNHNTPLTEDVCFSFPVLFCPKCGRPLTDAAWEMLEKRLEGAAHGD